MNPLTIEITGQQTEFRPHAELTGQVTWTLPDRPRAVEVRLFWYSEGKGLIAPEIVDRLRFDSPPASDQRLFRFQLPAGPYSFTGKILRLQWAVEVFVEPTGTSQRAEFTLSPTGQPIRLHSPP